MMKSIFSFLFITFISLNNFSFASQIQSSNAIANLTRANAVKDSFVSSFKDYLKYARGSDELLPLSEKGSGGFGNWGATFIDALDTAILMNLTEIVNEGIQFVEQVDFSKTDQSTISMFETTIRYIASLISVYELTGNSNQKLIDQAIVIGDKLLKGWIDDNDLPFNSLNNWTNGPNPISTETNVLAQPGTLILEFDRLSKYSKNSTYLNFAIKAEMALINSKPVLPGLYAQTYNVTTDQPTNDYVTWSGGSDSFFEYLIKYGQLIGSTKTFIPTWIESVKSSIEYLITNPGQTKQNLTILSDYSPSNGGIIPQFSHLGCFAPGNWILGGRLLNNDGIFQYGLKLANACINTYQSSITGIGPEAFVFKTNNGGTNGVKIFNETFYQQYGFDYSNPSYFLRPEVLESVFYAYRTTGDQIWQDLAWDAFNSIEKYCKAPAALASISQVNNTKTSQIDDSESFLYAELYKYLFLIFDDPNSISLDEYVFNTEAHPFKLDNPKADYSGIVVGDLPTPNQQKNSSSPSGIQRTSAPRPLSSGLSNLSFLPSLIFQRGRGN